MIFLILCLKVSLPIRKPRCHQLVRTSLQFFPSGSSESPTPRNCRNGLVSASSLHKSCFTWTICKTMHVLRLWTSVNNKVFTNYHLLFNLLWMHVCISPTSCWSLHLHFQLFYHLIISWKSFCGLYGLALSEWFNSSNTFGRVHENLQVVFLLWVLPFVVMECNISYSLEHGARHWTATLRLQVSSNFTSWAFLHSTFF